MNKIHIKKENRGKFGASAKRAGMGTQEYARHILANKDDYSSIQVKRAAFAKGIGGSQIKKHKHENGGILKARGGTTISSERIPTLEEYIQMKQQEARQMALANSYNATKPILAKRYYSDEDIKLLEIDGEIHKDVADKYTEDIYKYENMLRQPFTPSHVFVPNPIYMIDGQTTGAQGDNLFNRYQDAIENASYYEQGYKEILDRLELIKKTGYDWTGYNCITNATGWYGDPYVCASNINFKKDPSKYGFVEINVEDALPGDIFQYTYDWGEPYHATMYSKKGDNNLYYSNYANGNYTEPIKHDASYWGAGQSAYRFVGLPEDIEAWTREYNELYSKKLGGVLNGFKKGGILKAQKGTPKYGLPGGVPTYIQTQPFSPIDIAIKTAQVHLLTNK